MFGKMWDFENHHHGHHGPFAAGPRRGPWGGGGPRGRRGGMDWGDFFGPPPRAERGGVRYLVLDAIATQPRHGYEVIQAIEERSKGTYRPSPGVVYPTLQLLEEMRHVTLSEQEGRKVYAITDVGKADLEAHRDEVTDFYERSDEGAWERHAEEIGERMQQVAQLFKVFRRASRRGRISTKAQKAVGEVVDDAVKRIREIIEQDEG
jgi:DNA-binding PadR family transcriptional regulator